MRIATIVLGFAVVLAVSAGCRPRVHGGDSSVGNAVSGIVAQAAADPDDVDDQTEALAALGESAIQDIAAVLKHPDPRIRLMAVEALGKIRKEPVVDPLIEALGDSSWEVRQEAAEALGELRATRAGQPLLELYVRETDDQVRYSVLRSLGMIRDPGATPLLIRESASADPYTRMWAMNGLCAAGGPEAAEQLPRLLDDPDVKVRRDVMRTCARVMRTDFLRRRFLRITLEDPDFESSYIARQALVADYRARNTAPEARALIEEEARRAMKSRERNRALRGTLLVGNIGDPSALDGLVKALRDGDPLVRHHAAYVLSEIKDPRAVRPLIAALHDEVPFVQLAAAVSLSRYAATGNQEARAAVTAFQASKARGE